MAFLCMGSRGICQPGDENKSAYQIEVESSYSMYATVGPLFASLPAIMVVGITGLETVLENKWEYDRFIALKEEVEPGGKGVTPIQADMINGVSFALTAYFICMASSKFRDNVSNVCDKFGELVYQGFYSHFDKNKRPQPQ